MNLLLALDVLLREESVTVAAERMGLSAPAMSRTLERARKLVGDPLLVRAGKRLVPTPKALALKARIQLLADEARAIVQASATTTLDETERIFTLRSDESFAAAFAPQIMEALHLQAPKVRLRFIGRMEEGIEALRNGSVDLDVSPSDQSGPELKVQLLRDVMYIGAVRGGHPLLQDRLTPQNFAAAQHISAGRRGKLKGPIDVALEALGLSRVVALWVPTFLPAMVSAATSDLVAAVPEFFAPLAEQMFGLETFRIPLKLESLELFQLWHPRFDLDPAHKLLRQCVRRACQAPARVSGQPTKESSLGSSSQRPPLRGKTLQKEQRILD